MNFEQIQGPLWASSEPLEPDDVEVAHSPHVLSADGLFVFQIDLGASDIAVYVMSP